MNLYLLRHGQTDWTKEGRLQGHTDIPLNDTGREQVRTAAEELRSRHISVERILSSPLQRAKESAEIMARRFFIPPEKIIVEPLLKERCFGEAEGIVIREKKEYYLNRDFDCPGIESYDALILRARKAIRRVLKTCADCENVLLVSHGAMLYAMITALSDEKIVYFGGQARLSAGSLHRIRIEEKMLKIEEFQPETEWRLLYEKS